MKQMRRSIYRSGMLVSCAVLLSIISYFYYTADP
uniref:Uncharacterized protein n=1 Tax=Arundo donax TaxID=35708 RepID=A0A0A9AFS8_ARUDO